MGSRRSIEETTKSSISRAESGRSRGRAVWQTTGLERASGGKSHSYVTASSRSPSPSANTISVAEGSSETILNPHPSAGEGSQPERALQQVTQALQGPSRARAVQDPVVERERKRDGRTG